MIPIATAADVRELVRSRRLEAGLTQSELATALGRSRKWVHNFESGASMPLLDAALHALSAVGYRIAVDENAPTAIDVTEILNGEDDEFLARNSSY